jgi:MoaA/NifB/PqqE/SkfB family radical SAM enzyme
LTKTGKRALRGDLSARDLRTAWLRRRLLSLLHRSEPAAEGGLCNYARALDEAKPRLFEVLRRELGDPVAAKALALKLLNLRLAKRHFLSRDVDLLSLPPGLVVDPSNACNLACPGCVHSAHAKGLGLFDWKPGILPAGRFAAFLGCYGPSATHVTFCNYGEPLVNAHTPEFVRTAKRYLASTWLSTNMSLPRFDAEAYVESGLDYIVLSIDGATQAVYERFRQKGALELVYENTRKLVAAKERLRRRTPVIAWRFLAFEHNVHEIPAAMEIARQMRLDQFRADPAWDISWDDPTIRPAPISPRRVDFCVDIGEVLAANWNPFPREVERDSIERGFSRSWGASWSERADVVRHERASVPGQSCEWLYKSITMDAGGRIFPCCCAPSSRKDLDFGQLDLDRPGEAFNSGSHRAARLCGPRRLPEGRRQAVLGRTPTAFAASGTRQPIRAPRKSGITSSPPRPGCLMSAR